AISSFIWAVNKDQFEDLKGPAHSILLDDDRPEYLSNRTQNSVD
ncbi:MAG: cbb3-type cytochrome oxidase assembly protein CcoS, partial [Proteobacteria bacterium]|nr:cbb3-type cytochrome oxidase assembly protein CcoS [Pseudomonadota bacterium]